MKIYESSFYAKTLHLLICLMTKNTTGLSHTKGMIPALIQSHSDLPPGMVKASQNEKFRPIT